MLRGHIIFLFILFISQNCSLFISLKVNGDGIDQNETLKEGLEERITNTEEGNNEYEYVTADASDLDNDDTEDFTDNDGSLFFGQASFDFPSYAEEKNSSNFITILHKITSDNITRHGVTTIPSSLVLELIETGLGSVSGDTVFLVAMVALLPVMLLSMPFLVMLTMVPILVMIVLLMTGVYTSALVLMPIGLLGFGLYAAMDYDLHDFINEKVSQIPSFEEIEMIGQKISEAMENIEVAEEEANFQKNNSIPRLFY